MKLVKEVDGIVLLLSGEVCENCGSDELIPNTTEAAVEKHIPVYTFDGDTLSVSVGSVLHPMSEAHYIEWVIVETIDGHMLKNLTPNSQPVVTFTVKKEEVVAVYAYCNLHGVWKATLQ